MMNRILLLFLVMFLLVACSSSTSDADIETTIAQTAEAIPDDTAMPKSTPLEFTPLERSVLDWIAEYCDVPYLKEQILLAVPTERDHTGVGRYTSLSVPSDLQPIRSRSHIDGPGIKSEDVEHGGGVLLWLDDSGYIDLLEMYASGDHFAELIPSFELRGSSCN